jgi:fructuronate reductase
MSANRLKPSATVRPGIGIVHLGLGAFYRAHGAIYIAQAMAKSGGDWGILGVSLQSPTQRDALAPQGFAYTAIEQGPDGETSTVIEVVQNILVAREDPQAVIAAMADPGVKIVTLTVTEKGYCHEPSSGTLNQRHPDIVHDIANTDPVSAPGFLVRALQQRKAKGIAPFTVMTCDNLPQNGHVVRSVVVELARLIDPELADWIATEGRFPSTMVDRIVPATKPEDMERLQERTGYYDASPVVHEPFRQWVMEDDFVGGQRPDFASVGVQLVEDVTPFEHMKLRMLNGTHSSLAYLGYLAGHETIADTVADPVYEAFVRRLWKQEIIPALDPPEGVDLAAYADALLARYSNRSIRHRTWQIAMDGSQKLPQRLLGTLRENFAANRASPCLLLAVAAWMRYVGGIDDAGNAIDVKDPLSARLRALSDSAEGSHKAEALLSLTEVFSQDLAQAIKPGISTAYEALVAKGARGCVADLG